MTMSDAHDRAVYSVSWFGDKIATVGADNQLKIHHIDL